MSTPLNETEIALALKELDGWEREGDVLLKTFRFDDFRDALAFMMRAGMEAEELEHHPDWRNVYNRLEVRLQTHDAGGKVTNKDVALARRLDGCYGCRGSG